MSDFDVTLCKFYDDNFCHNEECPTCHCDGYQCIYKEVSLLREHCKFIDETNKILNGAKESLLKENEELKESVRKNKLKRKEATEKYQALKDFTNSLKFEGISKQLQQLKQENEELKQQLEKIKRFCINKEQKLEKIKRFCINKEEARLLYGYGNFDFYKVIQIVESEN